MEIKDLPDENAVSPGDMGELVKITDRKLWLAVMGAIVGAATFMAWGIYGAVETTISQQAVFSTPLISAAFSDRGAPTEPLQLVADVSATQMTQIHPGTRIYISKVSVRGELVGPLVGNLASIRIFEEHAVQDGQTLVPACSLADTGIRRVQLVVDHVHSASRINWAHIPMVPEGTRCTTSIVTDVVRPFHFLIPMMEEIGSHARQ